MTIIQRPSAKHVRRALLARAGSYQACYRAALRRRPGAAGTVAFWLDFPGVGLPLSVRHDGGTLVDPELVRCLTRAYEGVQLPRYSMGWLVRVRVPLAFGASRAAGTGAKGGGGR